MYWYSFFSGGPMVLKIPFSGASGIKATWKFKGKVVSSGGRYTIVTSSSDSTLTVNNFQEEDCGTYEVFLTTKSNLINGLTYVAILNSKEALLLIYNLQ